MLERILWFISALVLLALAFFFVAAAVVVGCVLGAALLARVWWTRRKIRNAAEAQILTTEYTVIERESQAQPSLAEEVEPSPPTKRSSGGSPGTE